MYATVFEVEWITLDGGTPHLGHQQNPLCVRHGILEVKMNICHIGKLWLWAIVTKDTDYSFFLVIAVMRVDYAI